MSARPAVLPPGCVGRPARTRERDLGPRRLIVGPGEERPIVEPAPPVIATEPASPSPRHDPAYAALPPRRRMVGFDRAEADGRTRTLATLDCAHGKTIDLATFTPLGRAWIDGDEGDNAPRLAIVTRRHGEIINVLTLATADLDTFEAAIAVVRACATPVGA